MYERLVGCVWQAAFEFRMMLSNGPTYCALASCWLSPHRLLRFVVRFELRRGTVCETIEFEEIEMGEPDEEAAVYR